MYFLLFLKENPFNFETSIPKIDMIDIGNKSLPITLGH